MIVMPIKVYRVKLRYRELAASLQQIPDIDAQPRAILQSEWEYARLSDEVADRGRRKKV